jgi:hypothetical protein
MEPPTCLWTGETPILNVTGVNTTTADTNINLTVSFEATNGCGNFNSFVETVIGDTTFIKTIAKYDGCVCTQDLPVRTGIYNFKKSTPGQYFLKFNKGTSSIIHLVTVQ